MLAGRLALQWGIVDVRAWLRALPRGALNFWEAFDAVEPIGEQWRQTAQLTWANTLENFKEPREPDDFMPPRFRRKKRRIIPEDSGQIASQFQSLVGAFGFEVEKHGNDNQRG